MSDTLTVSARVRVVLDIPVGSSWGGGCAFEQIEKQATDAALGALRDRNNPSRLINGADVVGKPEVTAIMVKRT